MRIGVIRAIGEANQAFKFSHRSLDIINEQSFNEHYGKYDSQTGVKTARPVYEGPKRKTCKKLQEKSRRIGLFDISFEIGIYTQRLNLKPWIEELHN